MKVKPILHSKVEHFLYELFLKSLGPVLNWNSRHCFEFLCHYILWSKFKTVLFNKHSKEWREFQFNTGMGILKIVLIKNVHL